MVQKLHWGLLMNSVSWQVALTQIVVASFGVIVTGGLLWWSLRRDPRPLRNGLLMVLTAYYALGLVSFVTSRIPVIDTVAEMVELVVLGTCALSLLLLPLLLIVNGIFMVRREHRSLGNLLSLLAGVALLVLPLIVVWLFRHENAVTGTLGVGLLTAEACLGLLFLIFMAHTALYAALARRARARAVIVLGAGLLAGQVPPLLAGRLQQALAAAQQQELEGGQGRIPIVPSGGQGADESRSEGEAMAEWLLEHGASERDILVEDRARTTEENLRYSAGLLQQAGIDPPYLIVTSNYHAPRAAMLARKVGLDAQAIGSPTAMYFWPSAYLREFIAVMTSHKPLLGLSGLTTAIMMLFAWLSLSA